VGQRTLPPHQPGTPRSPQGHGYQEADADQLSEEQVNEAVRAAEAHAEYLHEYGEPGSDQRARIDAAERERQREEEPLGRRLPEPLDASREGMER
jgi:hypothetical protein